MTSRLGAQRLALLMPRCTFVNTSQTVYSSQITSLADVQAMRAFAISGPTTDIQPAFTWNDPRYANVSHFGQPPVFNFVWQTMQFL